ncbi:NHL repeat-containing protein [bacterium]|nr:NHL repeat-containing protein [bacterium]
MRPSRSLVMVLAVLLSCIYTGIASEKYDPTTLVFPSFLHTLGIRKATKTHLKIYTRNKVRVVDPQGISAVRLQSWDDPDDTKDDDKVTGYGIDSGENIVVYNTSMRSLSIYGINAVGAKALKHPMGVAANALGDVYVADTGNHRIVRLFNPKKKLEFIRAIGSRGATPGRFDSPTTVALDSRNRVYVSDTGNHRVQILLPDDKLYLWFGKQGVEDGQLWHPSGLAVTDHLHSWSYYKDNFIALIDLDQTRLQKFTVEGEFLKAIRLSDFGFKQGNLAYVAIDYYSNIWVTDTRNHCIHKFDRDLNYLTSFGRKGTGDKEFIEPRGIAIYRRFGQVFVAEKESAQYYWIGTDIFDFRAQRHLEINAVELAFFLTEPSYVTLTVTNKANGDRTPAFTKRQYFSGVQSIYLNRRWRRIAHGRIDKMKASGNGSRGQQISFQPGQYEFILKAEPTYSSYKYFSKQVRTTLTVD